MAMSLNERQKNSHYNVQQVPVAHPFGYLLFSLQHIGFIIIRTEKTPLRKEKG